MQLVPVVPSVQSQFKISEHISLMLPIALLPFSDLSLSILRVLFYVILSICFWSQCYFFYHVSHSNFLISCSISQRFVCYFSQDLHFRCIQYSLLFLVSAFVNTVYVIISLIEILYIQLVFVYLFLCPFYMSLCSPYLLVFPVQNNLTPKYFTLITCSIIQLLTASLHLLVPLILLLFAVFPLKSSCHKIILFSVMHYHGVLGVSYYSHTEKSNIYP